MINLGLFIVGFILGIFALSMLLFLVVLHRPRYESPTLSGRRNRDRLPEVSNVPPMPECKPARNDLPPEPMYMYGVTGLEE
jgi:hypothetical protein